MKTQKSDTAEISDNSSITKIRVNPFLKLIEDKKRIAKAFKNGEPLSSLKDIKFVHPI
jgi:hypothetical protein